MNSLNENFNSMLDRFSFASSFEKFAKNQERCFGLSGRLDLFPDSFMKQSEIKPFGFESMFLDLHKQPSSLESLVEDHFSSFLKNVKDLGQAFKTTEFKSSLDAFKSFQENNTLSMHATLRQMSDLTYSASLTTVDFIFEKQFQEINRKLCENPHYLKQIIEESDDEGIKAYSLWAIYEYLAKRIPQYVTPNKILFLIISLEVSRQFGQYYEEFLVQPNLCIARSGCRIREQGTTKSKIETVIPPGEEVLVLNDHGHWKRVLWQKNVDEIFEGWVYCSLLEWKYKYILKRQLAQ